MDALSVVLQLKRIAADRDPPTDILSKIPRLGVGLSYFLEHPDIGVQHEAAKALLLTCEFHRSIIVNTIEVKELKNNAEQHITSPDIFLRGICTKLLQILNEQECTTKAEEHKCLAEYTCNKVAVMEEELTNEDTVRTNTEKSDLLKEENLLNNQEESICRDNTSSSSTPSASPVCNYVKQRQNIKVDTHMVEGDLYTLILALKKVDEEDRAEWTSEENFVKNLKQKIIYIPGVVSVTINIQKKKDYNKEEHFNKNEAKPTANEEEENLEGDTKNNFFEIRSFEDKLTAVSEGSKEEQKTLKVEIIAVVLIKLPFDKEKRAEILKTIRKSYFVLKVLNNEESKKIVFQGEERGNRKEVNIEEDKLQHRDCLNVNIPANNEVLMYLDDEDEEREGVRMCNDVHRNESPIMWSFFSNPLFLGESRYLGRSSIIRSGEDPNLIEKLQKEKEAKLSEKNKFKKRTTLDKVLDGISNVKFW